MIKAGIIFLFIFLLSDISAVTITEVEINPAGTDAGNEWIELENEEEISLEGYTLVNEDGKNISLNGNFTGYFIYTFQKQWLDNSNESISLYKNGELVDKTEVLSDSKNNNLTWQICDGSWKFLDSTKGNRNICSSQIINEEKNDSIVLESDNSSPEIESETKIIPPPDNLAGIAEEKSPEIINLPPISLNAQDIKTENNNEILKRNLSFYGLVTICVIFGALFLFKNRKRKNEFN